MKNLKRFVAAAACVVAVAGCEREAETSATDGAASVAAAHSAAAADSAAGAAGPAMWRTGDEDTTVYLFGTVHVLPPDLSWETQALGDALDASDAVYFETDVDPDPAELTNVVRQLGLYPPGQKLSDQLTPEQVATLKEACASLGLSLPVVDSMRPWLAATTLSERIIVDAGYNPESGVERTLSPMATSGGKEIRKFETVEQQLRVFADMPEQTQIDYLMEGLAEMDDEPELLGELVAAWAKGDVDELAEIMIREELANTPEIYEALLVKRNRAWADALDDLVKHEAGTFFVAVGAAHLAGEDSVVSMLADMGYEAARVQ